MPTLVQNLMLWSEDLSNGVYTLSAASITPDAIVAPDGTMTADALIENSANTAHVATQNVTLTPGRLYTWSVYAKAGDSARMLILAPHAGTYGIWFDVVTGEVGSTSVSTTLATIEPVDGAPGWFRCSVTFIAVAGFPQMQFYVTNTDGSTTYQGNGTGSAFF